MPHKIKQGHNKQSLERFYAQEPKPGSAQFQPYCRDISYMCQKTSSHVSPYCKDISLNFLKRFNLTSCHPVHICHAFLTVAGTKKERAHAAMVHIYFHLISYRNYFSLFIDLFISSQVDMGPAVLNGGVSTLIAFILLVSSDSHVFSSFFKIFLLVVLFGVRSF